jgi:hypothetical protein
MVRLPDQRSADRPPTISHHLKAYIYLPVVQCLASLSDGLAGYTFPLYNTLVVGSRKTTCRFNLTCAYTEPTRPY